MAQIVVDQNGQRHIFPDEATPGMIAQTMGLKPPSTPGAALPARLSTAPSSGGLQDVAGGMVNNIVAGLQKTSPIVNERYKPLGEPVASDAPSGYGWLGTGGEQGGNFDPAKHVMLRDPQTGKMMIYQRSAATDESILPSIGRIVTAGTLSGVPRLGATADSLNARNLTAAFDATQVTPTLPALLPGNRTAGLLWGALRNFPGSAGRIAKIEGNIAGQTQAAGERIAADSGMPGGSLEAGNILQRGTTKYAGNSLPPGVTPAQAATLPSRATSFGAKAGALFDAIPISPAEHVLPVKTAAALTSLTSKFPSSVDLAKMFTPGTFDRLDQALQTAGTLTWSEMKSLRSEIGKMIREPVLRADVGRSDLNRLYGALSQDMSDTAAGLGPDALKAFQRANSYYSAGMTRINDKLTSVFDAKSAETAYGQLLTAAQQGRGADIMKVYSLKRSLAPEDWADLSATMISDLGKPTPGTTSFTPGAVNFSAPTFVTNWAKMSERAKDALFGGSQNTLRRSLDQLAAVTSATKDVSKTGYSPSGPMVIAGGVALPALYHGTSQMMAGNPWPLVATIGGGAAANITARMMTWAPFVKFLATANFAGPSATAANLTAQLDRLTAAAPPEVIGDLKNYAADLSRLAAPQAGPR